MQKKANIRLLLDTHVFIWLINGETLLSSQAQKYITSIIKEEGEIAISAISLWEISMLFSRKRILLNQPCIQWLTHALQAPGVCLAELTPEIAVDSCSLPNNFHGDPADRIIIATARMLDIPLMTCDKKILTYSLEGFVKCVEV